VGCAATRGPERGSEDGLRHPLAHLVYREFPHERIRSALVWRDLLGWDCLLGHRGLPRGARRVDLSPMEAGGRGPSESISGCVGRSSKALHARMDRFLEEM